MFNSSDRLPNLQQHKLGSNASPTFELETLEPMVLLSCSPLPAYEVELPIETTSPTTEDLHNLQDCLPPPPECDFTPPSCHAVCDDLHPFDTTIENDSLEVVTTSYAPTTPEHQFEHQFEHHAPFTYSHAPRVEHFDSNEIVNYHTGSSHERRTGLMRLPNDLESVDATSLDVDVNSELESNTTAASLHPDADDELVPDDDLFRSIDGSNNSLSDEDLGAAFTPFSRLAPADYANNTDALAGEDRPSARAISNHVNDQEHSVINDRGLSDFVWVWGQFLDHDVTLTEAGSGESAPISVPTGDELFDPFGTGTQEIAFQRSGFFLDENGVRQHENAITAWVDGSQVYGSDDERALALREQHSGLLIMDENKFLSTNIPGISNGPEASPGEFFSGDVRSNENIALTTMHTLFSREHNRLAREIAETQFAGEDLTDPAIDEAIYQQARQIVVGQLQAITYNEFLPATLGENALSTYDGYDPTVDASIATEFSTAAFRVGHTMLSSEILRLDEDGNPIEQGNIALRDAFFDPDAFRETGTDPILRGLAANAAQEIDTYLVDDVRNFLFGPPGSGGFDLASLNIQRGRDHGLASYNDTRVALGLDAILSFEEISSDPEVVAKLAATYDSVDDIDLWVGGLAEDHLKGSSMGEVFSVIIADQFERLRDADRFWYENTLSAEQVTEINHTSLSDVIARNSDIDDLQDNVFFVS